MIHQPSGGASGMASDIEIRFKEIQYLKESLTDLYVKHNSAGKTREDFMKDMDRDYFMSAEEAVAYGLADKVTETR
jgi:ATP-dependent Clp protease protease subunit